MQTRTCSHAVLFGLSICLLPGPGIGAEKELQKSRLMTLGFDGSDPKVVFETTDRIEAPNWSPDGKWLVYNSKGQLYRIPADGSGKPTLIDTHKVQSNNDHVISPDGKTIYFSGGGHIHAVPFEGGKPRRVSNEQTGKERLVYWLHGISPDGKTLAFCGFLGDKVDIWLIPAAGGKDQRLTKHPAAEDGPDFSPDGKWLYFNSERSGSMQIWRMPASGGEDKAEQITKDERVNWFAHPSPDGKWLVYLSYPSGTKKHPRDLPVILRRMTPTGQQVKDLRKFNGGQGTINVPSWAPDSKRFAFVEYTRTP